MNMSKNMDTIMIDLIIDKPMNYEVEHWKKGKGKKVEDCHKWKITIKTRITQQHLLKPRIMLRRHMDQCIIISAWHVTMMKY